MGLLRRLLGLGPPRAAGDPRAGSHAKNPYAIHDERHPAHFTRGAEPHRRPHDGVHAQATAISATRGTINDLAARLNTTPQALKAIRAEYTRFTIPKRSGGSRSIDAPTDPLKAIQRAILHRILAGLPQHESCMGFTRGRSILDAARVHTSRAVVARIDIRDFFASTPAKGVELFFRRIGWDAKAAAELTRLCCHKGALPQGAPTSPRLANLLCMRLDRRLAGLAASCGARYTRYADDITLSFDADAPRTIRLTIGAARAILRDEGYRPHNGKFRIRRAHQRQQVLGLIVNNDAPRLPREVRRRVRAIEHHIATGRPATLTPDQLEGWRGYTQMIDRAT